jgi:hypothetical protein
MHLFTTRTALTVAAIVAGAGILAAGSALRPALANGEPIRIGPFTITTCSSNFPCAGYDNTASGPAFEGETGKGTGLLGAASKTGIGVEGTSTSSVGVEGIGNSSDGGYFSGKTGVSASGSSSGDGVFAVGSTGVDAVSSSTTGDVFEGFSGGGYLFQGFNPSATGVFTVDDQGNDSNAGYTTTYGTVYGGYGNNQVAGAYLDGEDYGVEGTNLASHDNGVGDGYAVFALGYGGDLYASNNSDQVNSFYVTDAGDVHITGKIYTSGSCSSGCVRQADGPGVHVISYTPSESQPTMEDFGEGQMVNGSAYVRLESTFAKTIDQTSDYLVFITPEGDSRGVYVTQKSPSGFTVRENQGGRSTLSFGYRIVAKPYGDSSPRLPMVNVDADMHAKLMALPTVKVIHGTRPTMKPPSGG